MLVSSTRTELVAEVYRLVDLVVGMARTECGEVPGVGRPEWWTAPPIARIAAILVVAEAWLSSDGEHLARERTATEQLKAMAVDLAGARSWTAAARLPSHTELLRRRRVL